VGDFNFVERRIDKSSMCGKLIPDRERVVFSQLVAQLGVADDYPSTSPIKYSWDNKRHDGVRVLIRLDRIYTFQAVSPGVTPVAEYYIKGDSVHSDHLAVWCKILLAPEPRKPSAYIMSSFYLKNAEVKAQFERIWSSNPGLNFFGKLRRCIKFYKEFYIRKAKERRLIESDLWQKLSLALVALQVDPSNPNIQAEVSDISDLLQAFERRAADGQRIRSRVKWMKLGDMGSKEFYRAHKKHSGASRITELEDSIGELHSEQAELEETCRSYYAALYSAATPSAAERGAGAQARACFGERLTEGMKACL
jgi:hypothetical protein